MIKGYCRDCSKQQWCGAYAGEYSSGDCKGFESESN